LPISEFNDGFGHRAAVKVHMFVGQPRTQRIAVEYRGTNMRVRFSGSVGKCAIGPKS
jgi:hypothetical protein